MKWFDRIKHCKIHTDTAWFDDEYDGCPECGGKKINDQRKTKNRNNNTR